MNCERYQEQIRESALGWVDAARDGRIKRHLAKCATCREARAAEVRLLEHIERGLAVSLEGKPSPEFAARVRMRVAEEGERARPRFQWIANGQAPRYAAITASALVVGLWMVHYNRPHVVQVAPTKTASIADLPRTQPAKTAGPLAVSRAPALPSGPARITARASESLRTKDEDRTPQFQVLVEPGQLEAVIKLYGSIWAPERASGSEPFSPPPGPLRVKDTNPRADDDLQPETIQIAPLEIASLDPVAADADSGGPGHQTQTDPR